MIYQCTCGDDNGKPSTCFEASSSSPTSRVVRVEAATVLIDYSSDLNLYCPVDRILLTMTHISPNNEMNEFMNNESKEKNFFSFELDELIEESSESQRLKPHVDYTGMRTVSNFSVD